MNNNNAHAGQRLRDRLSIVVYFFGGFVLIRILIVLAESKSILVEAVGAVVLFLLLVSLLLRYRILRNREEQEARHEGPLHPEVNDADLVLLRTLLCSPQHGLSQEVIDSLLSFKYSARSKEDNGECLHQVSTNDPVIVTTRADIENQNNHRNVPETCCSVCLADYVEGEELMMLPCRHAYHKVCVSQWLQRQPQCPLCKQDVLGMLNLAARSRDVAYSGMLLAPYENDTHNNSNTSYNETNSYNQTNSDTPCPSMNHVTFIPPDIL